MLALGSFDIATLLKELPLLLPSTWTVTLVIIPETVTRNVEAYIEDYNKIVTNQNGKEVMGNSIIFVDESVDVDYNDRIELVSRLGENLENYGKKYDIIKLYKGHGFERRHWEIII